MMRPLATIENIAGSALSKQSIFLAGSRYFSSRPWYRQYRVFGIDIGPSLMFRIYLLLACFDKEEKCLLKEG